MPTLRHLLASLLLASLAPFAASAEAQPAKVEFSIIRTANMQVREAMMFSGGEFGKKVDTVFSAILVRHGEDTLLFDTGLGRNIGEQYAKDMPHLFRPFFRYEDPVTPARVQLDAAGIRITRGVILSHAHWDHASGVGDFSGHDVLVPDAELEKIGAARSGTGTAWPSQVALPGIRWRVLEFSEAPYAGFPRSRDVFGDGRVVLVPMPGHTPGSVGMFVTVDSGKRYFFVGDVIWNAGALAKGAPKIWPASLCVDDDRDATQSMIHAIRKVVEADPSTVVVPAHDGDVQAKLGYFPAWVR